MIGSSIDYDPLDDITTIFAQRESLDNIDNFIIATKNHRINLTDSINNLNINTIAKDENDTNNINIDKTQIFNKILDINNISINTSKNIEILTNEISDLDICKKNLTTTMTFFQNLNILLLSFINCKKKLIDSNYIDILPHFKIMISLMDNTFINFKSVMEISKLLSSIQSLKSQIFDSISLLFKKILSTNDPLNNTDNLSDIKNQLKLGACNIIDSDSSIKSKLIDQSINRMLFDINDIFNINDEAGSLENLSRRYIYFKKVLNNFNNNYSQFFDENWNMSMKLTETFIELTNKDLIILLKRQFTSTTSSSSSSDISIDLFMNSLQSTLEFEKYIDIRFSQKIKIVSKLSKNFEPYMSLWIKHQEKIMNDKMITYMSEEKLTKNDDDDDDNNLVIPSSADLFRTYRNILSQTMELIGNSTSKDNISSTLLTLSKFFTKFLIIYSNKVLYPLLLPDNVPIENKDETVNYTVLLINTSDYCSITIQQLEDKLLEINQDNDKIKKITHTFKKCATVYDELLSKSNKILLNGVISNELSFVWREFNNRDWSNLIVEDYSRYMLTIKQTLQLNIDGPNSKDNLLNNIIEKFNRDVYKWNFIDKVIDLLSEQFIKNIVNLLLPRLPFNNQHKRTYTINQVSTIGEQLLMDCDLLKQTLQSFTIFNNKRVQTHIDTNLEKIHGFVRILITPVDSSDDYFEAYKRLTKNNCKISVWAFIFALRGNPWDINLWKKHWSVFTFETEDNSPDDNNNNNTSTKDLFVFSWTKTQINQFKRNLNAIQDPAWKELLSEMKLRK